MAGQTILIPSASGVDSSPCLSPNRCRGNPCGRPLWHNRGLEMLVDEFLLSKLIRQSWLERQSSLPPFPSRILLCAMSLPNARATTRVAPTRRNFRQGQLLDGFPLSMPIGQSWQDKQSSFPPLPAWTLLPAYRLTVVGATLGKVHYWTDYRFSFCITDCWKVQVKCNYAGIPLRAHAPARCSTSHLPWCVTKYSKRARPASAVAKAASSSQYSPQLPSGAIFSHVM